MEYKKKDPSKWPIEKKLDEGSKLLKRFLNKNITSGFKEKDYETGKIKYIKTENTIDQYLIKKRWKPAFRICLFEPISKKDKNELKLSPNTQRMLVAELLRYNLQQDPESIDKLDKTGLGLLHWAILKKNPYAVKVLIEEGINNQQIWISTAVGKDKVFENIITIFDFLNSYFQPTEDNEEFQNYQLIKDMLDEYIDKNAIDNLE